MQISCVAAYYLKTATQIILVTIYSKSDQSDITAAEVREIITRAEADFSSTKDDSEESKIPRQET